MISDQFTKDFPLELEKFGQGQSQKKYKFFLGAIYILRNTLVGGGGGRQSITKYYEGGGGRGGTQVLRNIFLREK